MQESPAVALLGPRQCGKTTLARELVKGQPSAVYLDLELPSERRKLQDPELFFRAQLARRGPTLFCLDEIQWLPELFPILRGLIDEQHRNGQFLILGSASRDLIRQGSESLAGRLALAELTPFQLAEVTSAIADPLFHFWLRGGFPRSLLAASDAASYRWRENFIQTFLERDIPQLGFRIPATALHRLWRMLAHSHGQTLNNSKLGASLGISHTTVRSYIDLLTQTFMVRTLEPLEANVKKRLVKSPKVYIRDSGILHSLLDIDDQDGLFGHPIFGASWEGLVVEAICSSMPRWRPAFYRTATGVEIDLVLSRGNRRIAIECKTSTAPTVTKGFHAALDDLDIDEAWIIAPVNESYPLDRRTTVAPLGEFILHCASV
jgi:predicted AAA+ superfamily ATPase